MPKNDFPLPDLVDIPLDKGFFLFGAEAGALASLFDVPAAGLASPLEGPPWLIGGLPTPSDAFENLSPFALLEAAFEFACWP